MKVMKKFWQDEAGQSTTEYILILAVVVAIAMKFKSIFNTKLSSILDKVSNDIESATSQQ